MLVGRWRVSARNRLSRIECRGAQRPSFSAMQQSRGVRIEPSRDPLGNQVGRLVGRGTADAEMIEIVP
jgi:hypothetical protein